MDNKMGRKHHCLHFQDDSVQRKGKALLSVLRGSVPNYWAGGSAEVEGQKATIAVQTSLPYKQRLKNLV
ncbi:hypothetical protein CY35_10G099900 [Sphagnum magellanicum]|nr:hypothetical protein CY35_10G099900 [Sphagnum magellanicum]